MSKGLNLLQQRFVWAYTTLPHAGNALQSAIAAGYAPKAAGQQGHHLLKNPKVREAIEAINRKMDAANHMSRVERLNTLALLARGAEEDGKRVPSNTRIQAIKELDEIAGDKTHKLEVTGELTLEQLINESMGKKPEKPSERPAAGGAEPGLLDQGNPRTGSGETITPGSRAPTSSEPAEFEAQKE